MIDISNGDLICSIFDKKDAIGFHIINLPDLAGNILAYGSNVTDDVPGQTLEGNHVEGG